MCLLCLHNRNISTDCWVISWWYESWLLVFYFFSLCLQMTAGVACCSQVWQLFAVVSGNVFLSACCTLRTVSMKSLLLSLRRSPCMTIKCCCSFARMAPGCHRPWKWLQAVGFIYFFVTPFPDQCWRNALCFSPPTCPSNDLSALCRDTLLAATAVMLSYKSISIWKSAALKAVHDTRQGWMQDMGGQLQLNSAKNCC